MKKRFISRKKYRMKYSYFILLVFISYILIKVIINYLPVSYMIDNKSLHIDTQKLLLYLNGYKTNESIITKPVYKEVIKPKIYLYNTHSSEKYNNYNVMDATRLIKNKLIEKIDVTYDEVDVYGIISSNNMNYNASYKITRDMLNEIDINYDLYIDIHRDSGKHDLTSTTIDNKNYAKIMFVVGGENSNYKNNYKICVELNELLKQYNSSLSRGVLIKEGTYLNQDINSNIILIEIGGEENTKEEVINTVEVLSKVLIDYLYEK